MEKALVIASTISVVANGGTVVVGGAGDVTFIPVGHNTFKLQGSINGGAFSDIQGSSMPSDTTLAKRGALSVFRPLAVDTLKVVMDSGTCTIIRKNLRSAPPAPAFNMGDQTLTAILIDPQLGTATVMPPERQGIR